MDFIPPPMPAPGLNEEEMQKLEEAKSSSQQESDDGSDIDLEQTDEQKIEAAGTQKQEGLEHFKKQALTEAISAWSSGITTLRGARNDEAKLLRQSLHANLSLSHLKLEQWADCISHCDEVLKSDSDNAKALFRRAKANLDGFKNGEDAKNDLVALIRKEPGNKEYRRMYDEAQRLSQIQKDTRKANYSTLFSKPGLYDDKEKERQRKQKEEEEAKEKRQRQFEDEMAQRAKDGEDIVDFDEWEKEKKEEKNRADKERREAERRARKASELPKPKADTTEQADEYTEEEKKILSETKKKGYCYFKNSELSHEERMMKQKINLNAPAKLSEEKAWTPDQAGIGSGLSSWNSAGTSYEERDMSKWAKECLTHLFKDVSDASVGPGSIAFTEVVTMEGDANAAVVRGTNRYFYDLDTKIKFSYTPIDEACKSSEGEILVQPTNVVASDDPDCPDWMKDGRIIWRSNHVSAEERHAIETKCLETILCLVKGFESSFSELVKAGKN